MLVCSVVSFYTKCGEYIPVYTHQNTVIRNNPSIIVPYYFKISILQHCFKYEIHKKNQSGSKIYGNAYICRERKVIVLFWQYRFCNAFPYIV